MKFLYKALFIFLSVTSLVQSADWMSQEGKKQVDYVYDRLNHTKGHAFGRAISMIKGLHGHEQERLYWYAVTRMTSFKMTDPFKWVKGALKALVKNQPHTPTGFINVSSVNYRKNARKIMLLGGLLPMLMGSGIRFLTYRSRVQLRRTIGFLAGLPLVLMGLLNTLASSIVAFEREDYPRAICSDFMFDFICANRYFPEDMQKLLQRAYDAIQADVAWDVRLKVVQSLNAYATLRAAGNDESDVEVLSAYDRLIDSIELLEFDLNFAEE